MRIVSLIATLLLVSAVHAQEICDNGIDDDGNGLIDLNDTQACPCTLLPPQANLISNGSFEEHTCCPGDPSQMQGNFIDCANDWTDYQISASADYYNPCGFNPPMIPQPVPDGEAVAGIVVHTWPGGASYEFLTQCLATPLIAGQTYELGFNLAAVRMQFGFVGTLPINFGPIQMALFGLDTCPPLPYTMYDPVWGSPMPAQYCPTELGLTELATVTYNPSNAWQNITLTFDAPFNVGAIMFGPACPIPQDYNMWGSSEPYFFIDDMSLTNVDVAITSTGHPCTNNLVLTASPFDDPPNSYQWYLDGVAIVGETGAVLNASALGLGAGTYTVRVIQADGSCIMTQQEFTAEYPVPLATATPTEGCAPLVVQFSNLTDPTLSGTLLWDLGDGTTDGNASPMHTYNQPGSYDVRLTVTTAQGCTADSLFEDLITVHPKPTASFMPDTTIGCVGLPVIFTDTSTPAGNYTCTWSFGDGGISNDPSPASHAYTEPGTYNVMLMVTSEHGCTDDVTMPQLIQVLPSPEPSFIIDPVSGCIPLNVRFDNTTPGQEQQTAFWDLGNGDTDTTLSTSTTYSLPGTYTVSLTMTNALGCSATLTAEDTIHAYGLPVVSFSVEPGAGCAPLAVQFQNTTDPGMIGGCTWDFGDGASSTDCTTSHLYQSPGSFNVSLHVTSPAGCDGDTTLYQIVRVDPSPLADFDFSPWPTDIFHPEVLFQDASSDDVVSWSWIFPQGDPASSVDSMVRVTFPGDEGGDYPVELIVANSHGCTDTLVRLVPVNGIFSVYVPNAFTPNNDGINDLFVPVIKDADVRRYEFIVFDRWGAEIFHSTEIGAGWDGTVNGEEPKSDVYSWKLRVRSSVNAESRSYIGKVVLLR